MANVERVYTIPLGHIYSESRPKRCRIAMRDIRDYAHRHMKSNDVRIGTALNRFVFRDSMGSPPRSVKVRAVKDESGVVWIDLFGAKPDEAEKAAKPKPAGKAEKKAEKEAADKTKKPLSEAEKKVEKEALKAEIKK